MVPEGYELVNLANKVDSFVAREDSDQVFDFSKGDPLKKTKIKKARKEKDGRLHFKGASGDDQFTTVSKFVKGGLDHLKKAKTKAEKKKARAALFDTMDDLDAATENMDKDTEIKEKMVKDGKCRKVEECKLDGKSKLAKETVVSGKKTINLMNVLILI